MLRLGGGELRPQRVKIEVLGRRCAECHPHSSAGENVVELLRSMMWRQRPARKLVMAAVVPMRLAQDAVSMSL